MSRYQPSYGDSGESRRSPRDQSPGRYNDRDEFRGGLGRGVERRRPSISDTRVNHNAFASNRETFREPIGRESSREFPPREPPRGPKVLIDAPTGPRASSYGGSDYRGDFGGYRGDYRGDRSRGRGRGGWRDDSRDRGREPDRDYRDRRDDRGPLQSQFRDDRGRERYTREMYRGRRQSPPQGRGRSPNYQPRDIRDPPPSIDLERTRRGSRDGPLSGGPPSSENLSFARGYGRGRGGRGGRGRGYYDEYHRLPGRSRSPDPSWTRRTQPSATPPPQVPAFGSTSSNAPVASGTSPGHTAALINSGPIPGVAVPTAPRFERRAGQARSRLPGSIQLVNHSADKDSSAQLPTFTSPTKNTSSQSVPVHSPGARFEPDEGKTEAKSIRLASRSKTPESSNRRNVNEHPPQQTSRKRRPVTGKRPEKPRKSPVFDDIPDEPSDSDSADDFEDGYFEGEIAKLKDKVEQIQEDNPIKPREEPVAVYVQPFIQLKVDDMVAEPELTDPEPCVAPKVDEKPVPETSPIPPSLAPTSGRKRKSRSATPLEENNAVFLTNGTAKEDPSATEISTAFQPVEASMDFQSGGPPQPSPKDTEATSMQSKVAKPPTAGRPRKPLMSDEFGAMSDDEQSQPATSVGPRKPMMSDEFATVSDEDMSKPSTNGQPRKAMISDGFAVMSDDEMTKPAISGVPRKPMMSDEFAGASNHELSEAQNLEALEAVRKQMRTPPLSSLPTFSVKKWNEDPEFLQTLVADPKVEARVKKVIQDTKERRAKEQEEARKQWKARYLEYRRWTDFSDDPAAKASRDKFEKSRARAAAEAAAPRLSTMPSAGAKPEPQRRTGSRWATEHDFERVLRESEQEAKETKEREERVARARTASAKEAKIPDMAWDEEEWQATQYIDKTHLIPFERSFAALEFGEPIDNFTEEEAAVFEATYLEFPKQFTKIAEALNGRGYKRDYKACIQHYYLVKHSSSLKEKLKKQPKKKKGRKAGGPKPKSNALMADLGGGRDEAEDGQDGENGERRRPRRAAAPVWPFETPASESEVASPAPTPGRKSAAAPKGDANGDAAPTKRKTKAPREKGTKQSKNNQLLAAAPGPAANRRADSPATPAAAEWRNQRPESGGTSHFPAQFDGAGSSGTFAPPYVPVERPNPSMTVNFDVIPQPFPTQERLESAPPINFESQQDRRNIQQTSSYWSVPEQNDFPALLRHFGTDWHGIAKWMTSKTHIMVYTTVFQQWLVVPSDTNKSRRVANIQSQVKNYYQRQVDSGKMKEWEDIARDADEKKSRGEETGPLPQPTVLPKRRYDMAPGSLQRSGSSMEGIEDLASTGQTSMTHASPPQPVQSTRFPALAQAGPVAQIQPATAASVLNKHLPPQPIQQAPQTVQQQQQQQPRAPRGPAMGYFTTDTPPRPIIQADAVSQRSLMVAQEAQIERNSALRLEREQREQQQQQQAMQRERHFQMKQEPEGASVHQYEPYAAPPMHSSNIPHSRPDPPKPTPPAPAEVRRTAPPQQFPPRTHQPGRTFLGDNVGAPREMKSSPSPAQPRPPMSAPPPSQEAYPPPPPPQPAPVAAIRQEPARKSNIMSLLNSDEPSDPRPTPPKRVSDVSVSTLHASQASHTPPPSHPLQTSRFAGHSTLPLSQAPQQLPQQMGQQTGSQQQQQQQQLPPTQHPYAQPTSHSLHQQNLSLSHSRSYTPTGFDNLPYPAPPIQQQQAPQQMYSQPSRQAMGSQPPPIRREQAHSEVHGITSGYVRTAAPSQSRLNDPPYSASPTPAQTPTIRQPAGSPLELAPQSERDYYPRSQQYLIQQPQQRSAAGSPQLGPTYHAQSQQPAPNHRHLAFGHSQSHIASPPAQYATHRPTHRSRGNSFDGRFQMATTSAPTLVQQSYVQAPHHPGAPLSMQYQQQQHSTQERYQERYPPPQDADMRIQEDTYRRIDDQRRSEDQRRMEDQRILDQRRVEEQRRMVSEEHQQRRHDEQRRLDDARRY